MDITTRWTPFKRGSWSGIKKRLVHLYISININAEGSQKKSHKRLLPLIFFDLYYNVEITTATVLENECSKPTGKSD